MVLCGDALCSYRMSLNLPPNLELKLTSRRIPRPWLKPLACRQTHGVTPLWVGSVHIRAARVDSGAARVAKDRMTGRKSTPHGFTSCCRTIMEEEPHGEKPILKPGTKAPVAAQYLQIGPRGGRGKEVTVPKGHILPPTPREAVRTKSLTEQKNKSGRG